MKSGQALLVAAMGRGEGTALQPGDLVEVQPAPEPGHDDLPAVELELGE
jgi:hypothetical protein